MEVKDKLKGSSAENSKAGSLVQVRRGKNCLLNSDQAHLLSELAGRKRPFQLQTNFDFLVNQINLGS